MKTASYVFVNDIPQQQHHRLSAVSIAMRNMIDATSVRISTASIVFAQGHNLDVRICDTVQMPVVGASVSLIERGLVFVGDWSPASGFPPDAVVGQCYRVTSLGSYDDADYEVDDMAVVVAPNTLERQIERFCTSDASGYCRLMSPYHIDCQLTVMSLAHQTESHIVAFDSGFNTHTVTMYPIQSVAHTPRGVFVSAVVGDRSNNIYL